MRAFLQGLRYAILGAMEDFSSEHSSVCVSSCDAALAAP